MEETILEMRDIAKDFPGVRALDGVNLQVQRGEIHALVGENGAGKSTLMKILSGFYPHGSYGGEIRLEGRARQFRTLRDSEEAGIAIIFQELVLARNLSIAENLFLGAERCRPRGILDWNRTWQEAATALERVGLTLSPATQVGELGVGAQQLVEIAKALAKDARILILDEPTAALSQAESENLLDLLRQLRSRGVTCIFISHRLPDVLAIADRITVLRDGRTIVTDDREAMPEGRLIQNMVGRDLTQLFPRRDRVQGPKVLEVRNWTVLHPGTLQPALREISFSAHRGEILGIAGLMGAGRTELAMSIFGEWGRKVSGELLVDGAPVKVRNASGAIRAGLALVSEDRKRYGLVLGMDIKANSTLASLARIARFHVIDANEEIRLSRRYVEELRTRTPSLEQLAGNLSGGNQQKVVLAKWLLTRPKVLILDEPTRGIDVGAKVEIYNIMNDLVDQGVCVVMISSELPEILGMSDRILVLREGRSAGILDRNEATEASIMQLAALGPL